MGGTSSNPLYSLGTMNKSQTQTLLKSVNGASVSDKLYQEALDKLKAIHEQEQVKVDPRYTFKP